MTDQGSGVASIELDKAAKALILSVPEQSAAGVSVGANVGFAIDNGKDYDDYIRFNVSFAVTDPGTIIANVTIPACDYASYELEFAGMETAITACFGMSVSDFNATVQDPAGDIAMYIVDETGNWDRTSNYTANGIGFWLDASCKVTTWGTDGFSFYVETHDGSVGIGRAPGLASGMEAKVHFIYASKTDDSKYIELVVNATLE